MNLRTAQPRDARRVAELHADGISEGFLSTLGPTFLRLLYRRAVLSPDAFVLVAVDDASTDETVAGFIAGAHDLRRFYRSFLVRDGVAAAAVASPRLFRSLGRVRETLRYPASTDELPRAEVLAEAVDGPFTGQGIGRQLIEAATGEFRTHGVTSAKVTIGSGNERTLRLYEACGFGRRRAIAVHGDEPSEVLVWPSS